MTHTPAFTALSFVARALGAICFGLALGLAAAAAVEFAWGLVRAPYALQQKAADPIHLTVLKVEGAPSTDEVERFVLAVVEDLKGRGRYDHAAERMVGLEVKVVVGEELVPPEPEHVAYFVHHGMAVPHWGRRIEIEWTVFEGKQLGALVQKNWIPAEQDPWMAFMDHGGVPAGVRGLLKLTDSRKPPGRDIEVRHIKAGG